MSEKKKTLVYKPKACQGDDATFSGQVIVTLPSYEDRLQMMIDSDMADQDDGENLSKKKSLQILKQMVTSSYPFYERVDLIHKKSKKHYKTIDELRYCDEAGLIINDVATWLMKADGLGKS